MVLSFPFLFLFISIFSISLSISPQYLFLVNAQPQPLPSSSLEFVLEDGDDYVYFTTAFIKELENLIRNFEYTFEIEGKYIFPNNTVKQDIVSEYKPAGYDIDNLNYELLGFNITASDIEMHINPIKIDDIKTRVNIPLLLNDVAVVLNVTGDHLGLKGIETLEQLAAVKRVAVEAVPKNGFAVPERRRPARRRDAQGVQRQRDPVLDAREERARGAVGPARRQGRRPGEAAARRDDGDPRGPPEHADRMGPHPAVDVRGARPDDGPERHGGRGRRARRRCAPARRPRGSGRSRPPSTRHRGG